MARVAAVSIHKGEEPPISGTRGAGNIFFSGCNLRCVYCQNYPISRMGVGRDMGMAELAEAMLSLEKKGAHTINLVTPTHVVPHIACALALAREKGLSLPVVYNSSGYEKPETLFHLRGLVDIYLPDMKYASDNEAAQLSGAEDYLFWMRSSITEMLSQVGHLRIGRDGLAERGVIVRHLVLPGHLEGTRDTLSYCADTFGRDLHISLMFQYFPAHLAVGDRVLGRRIHEDERERVMQWLESSGIDRGWLQDLSPEVC